MAYVTLCKGVIFIEGEHPRARKVAPADTRLGGLGAQLKNLNDLKAGMADEARKRGCNCVVNFTYGQRTKIIAIDDVAFIGGGYYAILSDADYGSIVSQL